MPELDQYEESTPTESVGELQTVIAALRFQLGSALAAGEGERIRFKARSVELEFEVTLERNKSAQGGIKFWVVSGDGSASIARGKKHRISLTLEPVDVTSENADRSPLISKQQSDRPS